MKRLELKLTEFVPTTNEGMQLHRVVRQDFCLDGYKSISNQDLGMAFRTALESLEETLERLDRGRCDDSK